MGRSDVGCLVELAGTGTSVSGTRVAHGRQPRREDEVRTRHAAWPMGERLALIGRSGSRGDFKATISTSTPEYAISFAHSMDSWD